MKNFEEIISESRPTVVDFYATWCGPCRRQIPIIDNFKEKMGDVVNVIKVDIDQERELADKYRIQSVPTIMIFKNGEVMWRGSGLQSHTDLMVALNGVEWR
ncbi:MAG: thioredoxin [Muribaculaceae bacterium]|nr:thioredoxin [Muribaculaceae bacterium]